MLAGDALLARGVPARALVPAADVARELAEATLGMIGGQYLDTMRGGGRPRDGAPAEDGLPLLRRRSRCALWAAGVPEREQAPWRAFADELGLLFQVVDDILDGDGYVARARARRRARRSRTGPPSGRRARGSTRSRPTRSVLAEIVGGLAGAHRT